MSVKKVAVGNIECGNDKLFLISGPCVIEDDSIMLKTAEYLKEVTTRLNIPWIFKSSFQKDNRSSAKYYDGPGIEKGVRLLERIKKEFDVPVLTDIHYPEQAAIAGEVVDILQIPAYLCMQTTLVTAAAKTGRVVNIKHGQFLAPENMTHPTRKVEEAGNENIILTERGYTFGYNDLIVDSRKIEEFLANK